MRARIAASMLGLFLLGGCSQPQVLYSERVEPAVAPANQDGEMLPHSTQRIGGASSGRGL